MLTSGNKKKSHFHLYAAILINILEGLLKSATFLSWSIVLCDRNLPFPSLHWARRQQDLNALVHLNTRTHTNTPTHTLTHTKVSISYDWALRSLQMGAGKLEGGVRALKKHRAKNLYLNMWGFLLQEATELCLSSQHRFCHTFSSSTAFSAKASLTAATW